MSEDHRSEPGETSLDDDVIDRAVDRSGVRTESVRDALSVLHTTLIGRHSDLEAYDYVTVDGVRAYRVPQSVWAELLDEFAFDDDVGAAVEFAHTEQAQLTFDDTVGVDERFGDDERGVVVGIDTAEEF